MPKQRVYELAKELGFDKQEFVTKINELNLGISVNNYMTVLDDHEVDKLKRAIKGDKKSKGESRKVAKSEPAPASAEPAAESSASASPVIRRRKRADEADVAADASAPADVHQAEQVRVEEDGVRAVRPVVRRRTELEVAADVASNSGADVRTPEVASTADVDAIPVVATSAGETSPASEPVSAPDVAVETAADDASESMPAVSQPSVILAVSDGASGEDADGVDAQNRVPGRPPVRRKGGAKVVGHISESVLKDRLAAENKNFSPGPARTMQAPAARPASTSGPAPARNVAPAAPARPAAATDDTRGGRRGAKRVVEARDLYDPKSKRGGKRRASRGGQDSRMLRTEITQAAEHKRNIRIEDVISVGDLAHQMGIKAGQVAMKLLELGMMATVNTMLDLESAALVAEAFGYTVENVAFDISNFFDTTPDAPESLQHRPPIITVMGHVDHGKTSLLDSIRKSSVTAGEAGGITQHIGAYTVDTPNGMVTFLDTPGHEAFTALRARGAKATDIVILVVAADDGVMPQTVEAINHARDAGVPIIVAINKIDKPAANPDRIKHALSEYSLIPEEWGGKTLYVLVSALQKINIEGLLEAVHLQAELEELRANFEREAQGLVIEAQLDVGRGPLATILVQRGTLKTGDIIVSSQFYGRVRTMIDDKGLQITKAGPSQPVEITGLSGIPEAGEPFFVVQDEKSAKRITEHVALQRRKEVMASRAKQTAGSLEDLSRMIRQGKLKELKVIIKLDVQGSVEALRESFNRLGNDEVRARIIHTGVGGITENDVNLAASSDAGSVIVGFNVRPDHRAAEVAEKYGVQIVTHNIIYDAIHQIHSILEGLLSPIIQERIMGHAEVREVFVAPKIGTIAGCYVQDGLLRRNARARLLRDGRVVYESHLASLRRFKEDVREVKSGFECGTSIENFNDIKIGDVIEVYEHMEVSATL